MYVFILFIVYNYDCSQSSTIATTFYTFVLLYSFVAYTRENSFISTTQYYEKEEIKMKKVMIISGAGLSAESGIRNI